MSIESRRAMMQNLMISEGVAGRPLEDDDDFQALAERWIRREIDMPEMRRLYQAVREERRVQKYHLPNPPETALQVKPLPSLDEFLSEMALVTRADSSE